MAQHDPWKAEIRAAARAAGFDRCGFVRLEPPPHAAFLRRWLDAGNAAGMAYLDKGYEKRLDPRRILDSARSIVSLAVRYAPPPLPVIDWPAELRGRIAAYAFEADYHPRIEAQLDTLASTVRRLVPGVEVKRSVDVGAVLEREWASLSGVGWFGKNTNILHTADGSYFFLAELITSLDIESDAPVEDRCGTCTRCLDLCPTGALRPGYELDARQCISYWTIEHRGAIPPAMRPALGAWIFGCDICQEVCPWNDKAPLAAAPAASEMLQPYLPELLQLDDDGFRERFRRTALWRTKREGLARNVAVVLGNSRNPAAVPYLGDALHHDPAAVVRGHAAWALGRIGGGGARAALAIAAGREADEQALAEIQAAQSLAPS